MSLVIRSLYGLTRGRQHSIAPAHRIQTGTEPKTDIFLERKPEPESITFIILSKNTFFLFLKVGKPRNSQLSNNS
jgi:hypothetical protein